MLKKFSGIVLLQKYAVYFHFKYEENKSLQNYDIETPVKNTRLHQQDTFFLHLLNKRLLPSSWQRLRKADPVLYM